MGLFSTYRLAKQVRDLEERLETAERSVKLLRAEWDDTYDKLRISMARIVKRAAVVEASEEPNRGSSPATPGNGEGRLPDAAPNGRLLTPGQQAIQQRILRRRAGL